MIGKINQFKDSLKTLKELETKLTGINFSDPEKMLESIGVNIDELESSFESSLIKPIKLNYVNNSNNSEPEYAYGTDSGFDLRANESISLDPLERALIPTGIFLDVPENTEIQVRPKSGLAIKRGLTVLNTPGTVDYGYTGEIKVIVINLSNQTQKIEVGDKIAQAVICPVTQGRHVIFNKVDSLKEKDRNANGFGSTGN